MNISAELDDDEEVDLADLNDVISVDELVDEVALSARDNAHGKVAYELLRRASHNALPPLASRLFVIDARNAEAS